MDPTAYTIDEFCKAHRISRAYYFKLKQRRIGPREMHVGSRVIISREAAADWRREREVVDHAA